MRLFGLAGADLTMRRDLLARLVGELSNRGLRVATLHEASSGFDPDIPGKDSYVHRKAGAAEVLLMAPHMSALIHENGEAKPTAAQLARWLQGADLVLIDGFEAEAHPKLRLGENRSGRCDASVVGAVLSADVDVKALADLVLARAKEAA